MEYLARVIIDFIVICRGSLPFLRLVVLMILCYHPFLMSSTTCTDSPILLASVGVPFPKGFPIATSMDL